MDIYLLYANEISVLMIQIKNKASTFYFVVGWLCADNIVYFDDSYIEFHNSMTAQALDW